MKNKINKKILIPFLFIIYFFAGIELVNATTCGPSVGVFCSVLPGVDTLADAIILVIQYLLSIVGILSLFFIIVGGIKYMLSSGNEEKMKSAKDTTYSAGLGLAIALMAYGILEVLDSILQS